MNPALAILGLLAFATALGLLWRARTGRVRTAGGQTIDLPEVPRGQATLLQFSTMVCAPCVPTRRLLSEIAGQTDGVTHVDLDLTHRPDLAARFNILQTPTTLIVDDRGIVRARIGGAPRRAEVHAALDRILAA